MGGKAKPSSSTQKTPAKAKRGQANLGNLDRLKTAGAGKKSTRRNGKPKDEQRPTAGRRQQKPRSNNRTV